MRLRLFPVQREIGLCKIFSVFPEQWFQNHLLPVYTPPPPPSFRFPVTHGKLLGSGDNLKERPIDLVDVLCGGDEGRFAEKAGVKE
jgi:hypothetical protein